ncbi:MAG TPA: Holliday junction resolvase RuvX [Candidatus Paceibacterota bacterium]|nr:Holliday junction resolvase RuvX [Candidatus Paceibacterota bacterium]
MRLLGIDYGSKRIGLALSDEAGRFAFPYEVVPATTRALDVVAAICSRERIDKIVMGKSLNYQNRPNAIMAEAEAFARSLAEKTSLPIDYEPEFMTSLEAGRTVGNDEMLDARAAALILKSYIDRTS